MNDSSKYLLPLFVVFSVLVILFVLATFLSHQVVRTRCTTYDSWEVSAVDIEMLSVTGWWRHKHGPTTISEGYEYYVIHDVYVAPDHSGNYSGDSSLAEEGDVLPVVRDHFIYAGMGCEDKTSVALALILSNIFGTFPDQKCYSIISDDVRNRGIYDGYVDWYKVREKISRGCDKLPRSLTDQGVYSR